MEDIKNLAYIERGYAVKMYTSVIKIEANICFIIDENKFIRFATEKDI